MEFVIYSFSKIFVFPGGIFWVLVLYVGNVSQMFIFSGHSNQLTLSQSDLSSSVVSPGQTTHVLGLQLHCIGPFMMCIVYTLRF